MVGLGQAPGTFWRVTPRLLNAYAEAKMAEDARWDHRFGVVAATVANVNRRRGARAVEPREFFQRAERRALSADELWERARVVFARAAPRRPHARP